MTVQSVILFIHSWVRWLVLLGAAAALVKHVLGLVQKADYDKASGITMSAFSGLMDLNVLLGVIMLIIGWRGYAATSEATGGPAFPLPQIEHLTTLLVATVVAHLPARLWKDSEASVRYRNTAIVIVIVVLLIVAGVMPLLGSRWAFRGLAG